MKTIGVRIKWKKYLYLILFLNMLIVDVWEFISLSKSNTNDILLIIMAFVVLFIAIFLFILTILNFIKKSDAISIEDKKVIIKKYKEKTIEFKDIKDIKYIISRNRLFSYSFGTIMFVLNDNKNIYVNDIKNVKNTCMILRNEILC